MSIEITEVRNAQYVSPRGDIELEIKHPIYGWIAYTIALDDEDNTIDNSSLIALANALPNGIEAMDQSAWDARVGMAVRETRGFLLMNEVDPIVTNPLRWGALTEETQQAWKDYRQALLNVPSQAGFPHDITWPEKP